MREKKLKHVPAPSLSNKIGRALWGLAWLMLFRPTPRPLHVWRAMLLRMFGAKIGAGVRVYQSARIWAPWNLEMGDHSCLGDYVDCYSVDKIVIAAHATVSQYSFLCTASHDYSVQEMPLVTAPITIGKHAWVAADVFVAPGVKIGEGAVVGARSTITRDVEAWTVVAGSPERGIGLRKFSDN